MSDAENRIQIIGRLEQALYAELDMLPIALRNEICQKIVAGVMSLWEATAESKRPLLPFKLNRHNGHIEHFYCEGCAKVMNHRNGKVKSLL